MKIFCIFLQKNLRIWKNCCNFAGFFTRRCLSARDKAGPFINKNQLNKTTKCLYLAVGCFFYVRISHIPPRAIGAHISLPAPRPPQDRPSPIEPHSARSARSARISPAVWHISPLHSPARLSAHLCHNTHSRTRGIISWSLFFNAVYYVRLFYTGLSL